MDIHFNLVTTKDGGIVIDSVVTDLICDETSREYGTCLDFFEKVLINEEKDGILSQQNLNRLKTVRDIKAFMRTVSGHISAFRYANPQC